MRRLCESNEGEFCILWCNRYLICRPRLEEYLNGFMVRGHEKKIQLLNADQGELESARKELEKNKEEKPVSQKMFRAI